VLLLATVACNDSAEETVAEPAADVASSAESDVGDSPLEEEATPIDPSKARAFLAFQEKLVAFWLGIINDSIELGERSLDGDYGGRGVLGNVRAFNGWWNTTGAKAEALEKMRDELGLSAYDVASLSEIEEVIFLRLSDASFDEQVAEFEKSLEGMAPEQRSEAEKTLEEFREAKDDLVGLKGARAKYGDAIVDAMLALEPELRRQYEALTKVR
jgi:hypothetical protein